MYAEPITPTPTQPMAINDRVPVIQKLGYGLGSAIDMWGHWLYPGLAYTVFNIFLGMQLWMVGLALMLLRILDAVSDPVFGWLSDNTRTRFGRRRPFILVGALLAGLGLPMLFWVSPGWGSTEMHLNLIVWKGDLSIPHYFWFMLGSSALFVPVMSCFNMPYQSLGAELTPNYNERTSVMMYRNSIQQVIMLAIHFSQQFITLSIFNDPATGKPNILRGAQVYTMILGALIIVVGIVMFSLIRERYYANIVARKQSSIKLKETIWMALRCQPFRIQLIITLAFAIGTSMTGALSFYDTAYYVCHGDIAAAGRWTGLMGISSMAMGFPGILLFGSIAKKFGKLVTIKIVLYTSILAFAGTWWFYNPALPWLQLFAMGTFSFGAAAFWTLLGSVNADVMDYDELESGKRREGAFASCSSWIMKCGLALGTGFGGILLSATGFDAKLEGAQSSQTILMIRLLVAGVPITGFIVAIIALRFFPLTRERMVEIRSQLEARRGVI